jgi:hypothetical protein
LDKFKHHDNVGMTLTWAFPASSRSTATFFEGNVSRQTKIAEITPIARPRRLIRTIIGGVDNRHGVVGG